FSMFLFRFSFHLHFPFRFLATEKSSLLSCMVRYSYNATVLPSWSAAGSIRGDGAGGSRLHAGRLRTTVACPLRERGTNWRETAQYRRSPVSFFGRPLAFAHSPFAI